MLVVDGGHLVRCEEIFVGFPYKAHFSFPRQNEQPRPTPVCLISLAMMLDDMTVGRGRNMCISWWYGVVQGILCEFRLQKSLFLPTPGRPSPLLCAMFNQSTDRVGQVEGLVGSETCV